MKKKKENRGGQRENAGRSLKYGEATIPVVTRVPLSRVKDFREYAAASLAQLITKKTKKHEIYNRIICYRSAGN